MLWRSSAPKRRPPGFIEPCIPTRVIHVIKHDGYSLIVRKRGDRVRLFTRRGFDWTERYPRISAMRNDRSGPCGRIVQNGRSQRT
jgi:ATP-dependent DNA ligase